MKNLFYTLMIGLLSLILFTNIKSYQYNCLNAYDAAIYHQYTYDIGKFLNANPFVTFRGDSMFTDHFEPILYFIAIIVAIFHYHWATIPIIEWLMYASFLLFAWQQLRKKDSLYFQIIGLCFILSKGLLLAIERPVHPSTWTISFWALLVIYFNQNNFKKILLILLFLCLFREAYPFCFIGLSGYYILKKEWKHSIILLSIGLILSYAIFIIRPMIIGPTFQHGEHFLKILINNPINAIFKALKDFNYISALKIYYPFFIPLFYLIRNAARNFTHPLYPTFFTLAPLLLLHLLANKFEYHYSIPFISVILGLLIADIKTFKSIIDNKIARYTMIILLILSSSSLYTKMFNLSLRDKSAKCIISNVKNISTKNLKELYSHEVKKLPTSPRVAITGGIIPQLTHPGSKFYQIGSVIERLADYDYLLIEVNGSGDVWPSNQIEIAQIKNKCFSYANKILQDDEFYFFAKGPFPVHCIY